MNYTFTAYGHENILSDHPTTLEFTKDTYVTKKGDCIVGIKADFEIEEIKKLIAKCKKENNYSITIQIETKGNKETVNAQLNPGFSSETEIVIRKSGFLSERTLAIKADKSSKEFSKALIAELKKNTTEIKVSLHNI